MSERRFILSLLGEKKTWTIEKGHRNITVKGPLHFCQKWAWPPLTRASVWGVGGGGIRLLFTEYVTQSLLLRGRRQKVTGLLSCLCRYPPSHSSFSSTSSSIQHGTNISWTYIVQDGGLKSNEMQSLPSWRTHCSGMHCSSASHLLKQLSYAQVSAG